MKSIETCPSCRVVTASQSHRSWCPSEAPAKSTVWEVRCADCQGTYEQDGRTPQPSLCGACGGLKVKVKAMWI
jgi:DnaJ-class molecular chaperone